MTGAASFDQRWSYFCALCLILFAGESTGFRLYKHPSAVRSVARMGSPRHNALTPHALSFSVASKQSRMGIYINEREKDPKRCCEISRNCVDRGSWETESQPKREGDESAQLVPSASDGGVHVATESIAGASAPSFTQIAALVAFCSLSVVICYADRANMADAILPMSGEYGWSKGVNGLVLSSFFVGYASTQAIIEALPDALRHSCRSAHVSSSPSHLFRHRPTTTGPSLRSSPSANQNR